MYKCFECGHMFEEGEEKEYFEPIGECWGDSVCVRRLGCPQCNGDFDEVFPCKICGRYKTTEKNTFCDECTEDVKERYSRLLDNNFTKSELELIDELMEDCEL